jgi:DNA-binding transcriptional ArsR family regulator
MHLPLDAGGLSLWDRRVSRVLGAVARWRILIALAGEREWLSVSFLASQAAVAPAACSKHMLELRRSGLVEQGMGRLYRLIPGLRPANGAEFLDLGVCQIRLRPAVSDDAPTLGSGENAGSSLPHPSAARPAGSIPVKSSAGSPAAARHPGASSPAAPLSWNMLASATTISLSASQPRRLQAAQ